jgi:hypothetical protein
MFENVFPKTYSKLISCNKKIEFSKHILLKGYLENNEDV